MQLTRIAMCGLFVLTAACSSSGSLGDNGSANGPAGGPDNTLVVNGTSEAVTARNYSCAPLGYRAAGSVLVGLGVDITLDPFVVDLPPLVAPQNGGNNNAPDPTKGTEAQKAYFAAKSSFGVADYANRNSEATQIGTAQLSKMGDLFISAAPEILQKFATSPRCGGVTLLDDGSHFTREALSCIAGEIITTDQTTLANQLYDRAVGQGMTPDGARELVVAGFLSAQLTCR